MLQIFTSPQGSTERIPLPTIDEKVTIIKVTRISPEDAADQEQPSIEAAFFGCMERKLLVKHMQKIVVQETMF